MPVLDLPQVHTEPRVIALLSRDSDGCLLWRNWFPINQLRRDGHVADWFYMDDFYNDIRPRLLSGDYNVVVTPRFNFTEKWMLQLFLRIIREANLTWLYDLDDDTLSPFIIKRNVEYSLYKSKHHGIPIEDQRNFAWAGHEYAREQRQEMIKLADGVTVSTDNLASIVKQYTDKPIYVVPNAIDREWYEQRLYGTRTIHSLTIGWAGGWRFDDDLDSVGKAWSVIAERYPDVHFVVYGYTSPALINSVPANRLTVLEWTVLDLYPYMLTYIDIGCCAVTATDWNMNKSPIKWIEMTLSGAACVATHALYGKYLTDRKDVLLATTVDEWVDALSALVEHEQLRISLNHSARENIVSNYLTDRTEPLWLAAWQDAMERKHVVSR